MRESLNQLAEKAGEYCGLPPMIDGERLIVTPSHRAYKFFEDHARRQVPESVLEEQGDLRNAWWSSRLRADVMIWREPDGKFNWGQVPTAHHLAHDFRTMACSIAWSVAAECQAMRKLADLIPDHLFRGYFLSGMFLETSKRSGVTYIFRRLKPTVALRPAPNGEMRIIACLCMHPIGYYAESWAGALVPTDDVIAHLMTMRGDEKYYWRKANQIPPFRPEAGL